jgi:asparagine synthase (glutamine-hydrolysing)
LCGITGFTHRGRVVSGRFIRSATNSLVHRGPDQQGVYESADVSLGAVRLKIIDLVGGDQPMSSEDGDTVIVFNGEIYNHDEVRQELLARGHRFTSRSDTEVALRAYGEWDLECFSRLRGMFGLAFWNISRKRLVLARDRLGIKPLYYCRQGSDLYFGSELKALFEHPEVGRQINLAGLNCYLCLNYVPAPHTLVEGIQKLPPGHFLEWLDGKTRMESYWQPPDGHPRRWHLEDAKRELDCLLRQSVREHLVSDVPLGIWASGGLDSSTILHYAAEASNERLKTFSVTFQGRSFDESRYIRQISERYGTEHWELDLNAEAGLPDALEKFAYYSDEPSADAGAVPVWFLAQMSRRHATVALSGEGADELFGGYITYLADRYARWLRRISPRIRKMVLAWLRHWPVSDEKISFEYKLKRFLQGSLMSPEQAHVFWNGAFAESEKGNFFLEEDERPLAEVLDQVPGGEGLNPFLMFDQRIYLPNDILYKVDRMSMAHSLEVRPPFLDHRIVEFAASLPEGLKIRGSNLKFVLRELMKDKLPPSILRREKMGFDIPAHDWLRGALKPFLLDTLTENAVKQTGLFRWEGIKALLRDHLERRANLGYHLWGLMILLLWIKRWKIQTVRRVDELRSVQDAVGFPTPIG